MKSLIGKNVDFTFLINKANTQVLEHGRRHGLGHGAAAIDLAEESQVPVESVRSDLNAWAKKATVVVDKVFVFAGSDLKVFGTPGRRIFDSGPAQGAPGGVSRPIDPGYISNLRSLVGAGRYEMAQQVLHKIESVHGGRRAACRCMTCARADGRRKDPSLRSRSWCARARRRKPPPVGELRAVPPPDIVSGWSARAGGPAVVRPADACQPRAGARHQADRPRSKSRRSGCASTASGRRSRSTAARASCRVPRRRRRLSAVLGKVTARPKSAEDKKPLKDAKRAVSNAKYYEEARKFGQPGGAPGRRLQLAAVTGGGPGIMEAANRGAMRRAGPAGFKHQVAP